jgi:hypothetical protein
MNTIAIGEMRERMIRWTEEGQSLLGVLLGFLYEYERLRKLADTAERECERLREEVGRLQTETDRYRSERAEIADSVSQFTNELLLRLRPQQE